MSFYTDELFFESAKQTGKEHMLLGASELDFLAEIARHCYVEGTQILEIGTFVGRTSAYLANKGYPMVTIESHNLYVELAQLNWQKLGLSNIQLIHNQAQTVLNNLSDYFDSNILFSFVFIDANKGGYLDYYESLKQNSNFRDAILVFDNIFLNNQLRSQVENLFLDSQKNTEGLINIFGDLNFQCLNTQNPIHRQIENKGPEWSNSVKNKILTLCESIKDQHECSLIETSDGMLICRL